MKLKTIGVAAGGAIDIVLPSSPLCFRQYLRPGVGPNGTPVVLCGSLSSSLQDGSGHSVIENSGPSK
jgi:hypothetical protein